MASLEVMKTTWVKELSWLPEGPIMILRLGRVTKLFSGKTISCKYPFSNMKSILFRAQLECQLVSIPKVHRSQRWLPSLKLHHHWIPLLQHAWQHPLPKKQTISQVCEVANIIAILWYHTQSKENRWAAISPQGPFQKQRDVHQAMRSWQWWWRIATH
jgi:hypothetical protein